jgi:hypothetical protein
MQPIAELQQREQKYIAKRQNALQWLHFEKLDVHHTSTDFIINGKRVQEKVCGFVKNENRIICTMGCNNGREDGKQTYRTYRLGENDFYWLHSSVDDRFWVIPERILYREGYISKEDETMGKKGFMIPLEGMEYGIRQWMRPFEYNYKNPDKERLLSLFGCV